MSMTLSTPSTPLRPACLPGRCFPRLTAGQGLVEDLVDQRALPRPRDACDAGEDPEREPHVHVFQVMLHGPEQLYGTSRLPPLFGRIYPPPPGKEIAGYGTLLGLYVLDAADRDDLTPVDPRAWTNVYDVVGRTYSLLVVLDDDERVPEVP